MSDDRGMQFDILDKSVAARATDLYARSYIARQTYDEWQTDYNQLRAYATANSDNAYIARQWAAEEPRYANVPRLLQSKIQIADPSNYDTAIHINGLSDACGCGGSKIPQFNYTPSTYIPGNNGMIPSRNATQNFFGGLPGSLGDTARQLFSPSQIPFFNEPGNAQHLVDKTQLSTGILVAIIVGGLLWAVHYLTKKNPGGIV